ncbi:SSI family serine proteinase inhibitor [Streptomyces sp. NPDC051569]|uniref:SSI family serine proteinase inhibitor n=1 Tax=Streptomyces sp. NPDC051569 TaxID=3365661 RepID=UPI0037A10376
MLRRLGLTAAVPLALLGALAPAASAVPPLPLSLPLSLPLPLPQPLAERQADQFTVTVADSGVRSADGAFKLKCGPVGGTHPQAKGACDRLAELAKDGKDPFAPVPKNAMCTMLYGGAATARITGMWRGHAIDATFNRTNGCEISRWRTLEPVLPSARQ